MVEYLLGVGGWLLLMVTAPVGLAIGLPVWLYHRRRVLEIKGTQRQQIEQLHARLNELERRCDKLQEQVTAAHLLVSNTDRDMEKRLASLLESSGACEPTGPAPDTSEPQPTRARGADPRRVSAR